jgi:ribosome-associated protein YbcJ (S4-like RNA binding protein)
MEKEITPFEIDTVMEYWQDITQDPQYISTETQIEMDKVISILKILQSEGKIKFDMTDKIIKFNEMVDPQTLKSLNITKRDDSKYFFTKKKINKIYDSFIFDLVVHDMELVYDILLRVNCTLSIKGKEYPFVIIWESDDKVYYATTEGKDTIKKIMNSIGDNIQRFHQLTLKVLTENVPDDLWEYRAQNN